MGQTCPRCGKELSWHERQRETSYRFTPIRKNHPEFVGKKLCHPCVSELSGHGRPTRKREDDKPTEWHEQPFKEAIEQGRRIVVIKDAVFSADGIGKHIELYSNIAEKFGYVYKSETHFPDGIVISLSIIFEKAITTANETKFVSCDYCKTRYDANQYFKCPQCGSPAN